MVASLRYLQRQEKPGPIAQHRQSDRKAAGFQYHDDRFGHRLCD